MNNKTIISIIIILLVYFGLSTFGGPTGRTIMLPLILFVTFLHELGHALGALITGGEVISFVINGDGSGVTTTAGGMRSVIIMGGYIGSAILGNLMFYIGAKKEKWATPTLYFVAVMMIAISIIWFSSLFTTFFLVLFSVGLLVLARWTNLDQTIVMFLGLASIIYIIQDFNVGPSSDLAAYADLFVLIPANVWMYIWLIIVLLLFAWNIRLIFKKNKEAIEVNY